MNDTGPMLRHFPPSRSLAGVVAGYWYSDDPAAAGRERKLPAGVLQLLVNLDGHRLSWFDGSALDRRHAVNSGIAVTGCITRPVGIDLAEQRRAFGIVLSPAGARACLGVPASILDAPLVDVADILGSTAAELRERLLTCEPAGMVAPAEDLLLCRLANADEPDAAMAYAADRLRRGVPVNAVVETMGMSTSTFARRFRAELGLRPKTYQRLHRVHGIIASCRAAPPDWADLAACSGFSDQAHLINDFVEFTGLTPTQYQRRAGRWPLHVC